MADSKTLLEPDKFYHIYNHAVGNENLFNSDNNYLYFLNLLKKYLITYLDIYAYCLIPNHFHLIIKIKNEKNILSKTTDKNSKPYGAYNPVSLIISHQFSNLFNSYAQSFNKENNRKGSLFVNRFKRKLITNQKYLLKLIHYIHFNPVMANLCEDIRDWKYSSYNAIINNSFTLLERKQVIDLFDDKSNFIYCHKTEPIISGIE